MERTLLSVLEEYERVFLSKPEFRDEKSKETLLREFNDDILEIIHISDINRSEVKAFCIINKSSMKNYYIEYLGVSDKYQGRGLGKRIMNIVIDIYCKLGQVDTITLLCLDDKVPFYEKLNFEFLCREIDINNQVWNKMIYYV